MIAILEPSHFSLNALEDLSRIDQVKLFDGGDVGEFIKDARILFVRLKYQLDACLLDSAKSLEVICTPTTGLNHIDKDYCQSRNIRIISLKGETAFLETIRATPEHTLGLLLALYRNYRTAFLTQENPEWNREKHKGYEIYNSHIGIIGFGRVGSIVGDYLVNMGAHVGFYDKIDKDDYPGYRKHKSIEALICSSDAILLCSSYNADEGSIINQHEIDLMRGKYFINTARAELTDENYLLQAARDGLFMGIAIDVITEEQSSAKNLQKWLELNAGHNVLITPHIGGATYTSMARTEDFIVSKLRTEIA